MAWLTMYCLDLALTRKSRIGSWKQVSHSILFWNNQQKHPDLKPRFYTVHCTSEWITFGNFFFPHYIRIPFTSEHTCYNQGKTNFISNLWHDFIQTYLRSSVSKEGTEVSLTDLISDAVLPTDLIISLSSGETATIRAYCLSESAVGEVFFCVHYNGRLNRSGAASSVGHKTAFRPNKTSETDGNQLLSSLGLISESFISILMCRNQSEL